MKTYRYLNAQNSIVSIIDEDGISRSSGLASALPQDAVILPYIAPPVAVPPEITMRQARLALLGAGKLSSVDAAIAAMPEPQKSEASIEWNYSNTVQRNNGFVSALGPALGLTESQVDALFIAGVAR
jgi:hypothetical protein